MKQFRIGEEGYRKLKKRWLYFAIPFMTVVVLVSYLSNLFGSKTQTDDSWLYFAPIFPIIYGIIMYRALKRQQKFIRSFVVTISNNEIMREQMNTPPLTISFMEIKEIAKYKKGSFRVKGAGRTDIIAIPTWIENRDELEKELEMLAPITAYTKDPWFMKFRWVPGVLAIAMYMALLISDNKPIAAVCGVVLAGLIIWAIYYLLTSKNVPTSSKKRIWIFFLILLSILYLTYTKLTN
jgi:uncharacterized membrane protein